MSFGLSAQSPLINEIHHSPDIKQERVEFIELYWPGETALSLEGWRLTSAVDFTFPPGATLPPGEYLVVAQDPDALSAKFGVASFGPWTGRLSGSGETIRLRNPAGQIVDEVDYRLGFPWPTVGEAPGYSIELIHPDLDNGLGGNWRASVVGNPQPASVPILPARSEWLLWKGTSPPTPGWTDSAFDDRSWLPATGPVGYDPDLVFGTELSDMRGAYTQFFLRRTIDLTEAAGISALRLEALFDDGFKLWLNGTLLFRQGLGEADVPFNRVASGEARESNDYQRFDVPVPAGLLREGANVLAVQVANIDRSGSSDCFFDARLLAITGPADRGPTPGRANAVRATNAPPAIRQVEHWPRQPRTGEAVTIRARITDPDGVADVQLEYQIVAPGRYVRIDDPEYSADWTALPMNPSPADPDVFQVVLPAAVSQHRHLVRYRLRARDSRGGEVRVPYADDPTPNFALFCYDGVPPWTGAVRPGTSGPLSQVFTVDAEEMNRLPVYHLVARRDDVEDATWFDRSHGDEYFWTGTLVYDGDVYDHIRFRPRGGVWRYAMGKNMWKFDFNPGRDFQAHDNWGQPYQIPWTKLNLGACIQQGNFEHRGEQGLFESVGFRLFQLAGVPASHTTFVQFRIIDDATEAGPDNQYEGDFWGLYLATEQVGGRFLDEHGLPDGNLYKMEAGTGEPNNLGHDGPVDSSDLATFLAAYRDAAALSETWWRTHLNLESYYSYQTIVQAIHHYDIADGKNYFYYHHPQDGRWTVLPWDLDLTWADNMYRGGQTGGNEPFKSRVLSDFSSNARFPAIAREFRNRVREIRDLLWNTDETFRLIDEYVGRVRGTNAVSLIDADRAQWDYNPVLADSSLTLPDKAGQGRFYRFSLYQNIPRTFAGAAVLMKNYVRYRASDPTFSLDVLSREPNRPTQPVLSSVGPEGFPVNQIRLAASPYEGSAPFRSLRWRVAEISRVDHPSYRPEEPMRYEIEATWDSGERTELEPELEVPGGVLRVGHLYRARVRYADAEGRTSHWSAPVEFTAGEPASSSLLTEHLRITEMMYHPLSDGFEYLELHHTGTNGALPLAGVEFASGIDFVFPPDARLEPGGYALLIQTTNHTAFRQHYGLDPQVPLFGPYRGNLDNAGETLVLLTTRGGPELIRITYDDRAPWPAQADGDGYSLVARERSTAPPDDVRHWRRSTRLGGSPGASDPAPSDLHIAGFQIKADGIQLEVQAADDAAWVLESSSDLSDWSREGRFLGPAAGAFLQGANTVRFFRAQVE